jgi:protein-ribulosamine 3-kinase
MLPVYQEGTRIWRTMPAKHPLVRREIVRAIERAASDHLGRPWMSHGFEDLDDRSSHPCGIHRGEPFSVFAKLGSAADANGQFQAELRGLTMLSGRAGVLTPTPVATGIVEAEGWSLLLSEALPERTAAARSAADLAAVGKALAAVHLVHHDQFGLEEFDGFFGPIEQDNRPVPSGRWADFYASRRISPMLRAAADSGNLPRELSAGIERLIARLPGLCGPEPVPSLLHGDAQQNNFLCAPSGAYLIDVCPYFGHPELDLALLDYFEPVPAEVFAGYREVAPIDPGFAERRELWRVFAYLAVVAVDGQHPLDRHFISRLASALRLYA